MCDSQFVSSSHFFIRSADREDLWNSTPSKFRINLQKSLKGSKAQISYAQLAATYYNITQYNNKINAGLGSNPSTLITITPGCYTLNELLQALQTDLSFLGTVSITFSQITNLITISNSVAFSLDTNIENSLSVAIGFPPAQYLNNTSFTATFIPKVFDNAIYISCNFATAIQTSTSKLHNISFVIPHTANKNEIIQYYASTHFALQPRVQNQTLGYLEFSVFDERGNLLQGLGDWCLMLEII